MSHITIAGNEKYCRAHDLIQQDSYPCPCKDKYADPDPTCEVCSGGGRVEYEIIPFEMDLAEQNFSTLWHALGLGSPEDKWIQGITLLRQINSTPVELLERAGTIRPSGEYAHEAWNDPGIDLPRAEFYLNELKKIAEEAAKRESLVIWS